MVMMMIRIIKQQTKNNRKPRVAVFEAGLRKLLQNIQPILSGL